MVCYYPIRNNDVDSHFVEDTNTRWTSEIPLMQIANDPQDAHFIRVL